MKKLITIILILALILPAAAGASDPNEMSFDELKELNKTVQLLLFEKGALTDGVLVPPGIYMVGEDIPAGTYRIEFRPKFDMDYCIFMAVNEETISSFMTPLGQSDPPEIGKLELTTGTRIELTNGGVYFYTYTGLFH